MERTKTKLLCLLIAALMLLSLTACGKETTKDSNLPDMQTITVVRLIRRAIPVDTDGQPGRCQLTQQSQLAKVANIACVPILHASLSSVRISQTYFNLASEVNQVISAFKNYTAINKEKDRQLHGTYQCRHYICLFRNL